MPPVNDLPMHAPTLRAPHPPEPIRHLPSQKSRVRHGGPQRSPRFLLLGRVSARVGEAEVSLGPPQQQAVIAALLLRSGSRVSVDQLIDEVWGEHVPATAVQTVRTYVYRLRQALARHCDNRSCCIRSVHNGYTVDAPPDAIDVNEFSRSLEAARRARRTGSVTAVADHARQGLSLWRGNAALSGIPGEFAQRTRNHLQELRLSGLEMLLSAQLSLGIVDATVADVSALVAEHPLDERFRALLMIALYKSNRRSDALRTYFEARTALREQLGVDVGEELQRAYRCILTDGVHLGYPQYSG
jgi:DNA-binding SARP family transcriptional activator